MLIKSHVRRAVAILLETGQPQIAYDVLNLMGMKEDENNLQLLNMIYYGNKELLSVIRSPPQ